MVHDESLTAAYRAQERLFVLCRPYSVGRFLAPFWSVAVVQQQCVVLFQVVWRQVLAGRLGHIHLNPVLRQKLLEICGGRLPIVSVVAGYDEQLDRRRLGILSRRAVQDGKRGDHDGDANGEATVHRNQLQLKTLDSLQREWQRSRAIRNQHINLAYSCTISSVPISKTPGSSNNWNRRLTREIIPRKETMKTTLAFLVLVSVAQAQNLTSNVPYASPAHERQVLDIYTPEGAKNLPVVFWIHGGGWQTGDKTSIQIKPRIFAEHGFVFVSTNYRLLPTVEMGDLIRDVAKSLGWVHKNIANHGGDPKQIFVMGHSAGAQLAALICID